MLHVTNGDHAADAIRAAGIAGPVLAWRDVLHDGPVPAGLDDDALRRVRARFLAGNGWTDEGSARADMEARDTALLRAAADEDEVVLWFEHDLYDQLQLLQVLDLLARSPRAARLSLVGPAEYLGAAAPHRLTALFAEREEVGDVRLALGRAGWEAFRAPDPRQVERVLAAGTDDLPHLGAALRRHLRQLPWTHDGLSLAERRALQAVAAGHDTPGAAFRACAEDPVWLGDSTFALHLQALSGDDPLLTHAGGTPVRARRGDDERAFWSCPLALTPLARAVLAGEEDAIRRRGIDRWLGGVHLVGREVAWRWDEEAGRVVGRHEA